MGELLVRRDLRLAPSFLGVLISKSPANQRDRKPRTRTSHDELNDPIGKSPRMGKDRVATWIKSKRQRRKQLRPCKDVATLQTQPKRCAKFIFSRTTAFRASDATKSSHTSKNCCAHCLGAIAGLFWQTARSATCMRRRCRRENSQRRIPPALDLCRLETGQNQQLDC